MSRATRPLNEYYLEVLSSGGTPAVSSWDAFLPYRPSGMPHAGSHALGNASAIKTAVLFEFLRDRVSPAADVGLGGKSAGPLTPQ